jgi:hypothetical protein
MAAGTGRIALKQVDASMAENARQIEMPEVPIKKEAAPPKPARPEPPKLRSQWPAKPQIQSEAPRPANRFESPPPPAPYILTPDTRHIDAYWRSRHQTMGSAHDEQNASLRRVSNPAFDTRYRSDDYRDHDDYDDIYQNDEPELAPARRDRRSLSRHGRTGRDLAIAAGLALSLSTVTGAAVYDRASGGTIAAAIMAPFAGERESQAVAEVPNVIVTTEEAAQPPAEAALPQPAKMVEVSTAPEPLPAPQTPPVADQAQDIKPIATAKLEVTDSTGIADTPVDLDLRAVPGQAGQDLELRISGMPEDANLTAGTKISPTSWSLKPAEAAIVKLVMPAQRSGEFDLSVAAVETKTGELVAPMQEINVRVDAATPTEQAVEPPAPTTAKKDTDQVVAEEVPPPQAPPIVEQLPTETVERAAVPPPQVTAALNPQPEPIAVEPKAIAVEALPPAAETVKLTEPAAETDQTRTLISRGDHLMSLGDLAAAREFYMEALKLGAAPTTLLQVGMTYDPVVYAANKVAGLSPDRQMALQYYRQADQAGVTAARDAIARLEAWTQN